MEDNEKVAVEQGEEEKAQEETKVEGQDNGSEELTDFSKFEPEVRKRPIDYIEERKARRAEHPAGGEAEEEHNEEELSPKAQEFLRKEAEKLINPIKSFVTEDWNKREIAEVLSEKPEWSKYKPLAEKYMKADGWQGVPAKRVFQMLDYEHSGQRGAEEARLKSEKANRAKGGESAPARSQANKGGALTAEDIARLSPEQIIALQKRLATGEQIKT